MQPLIDEELQLERFPGKGGWTFVEVPNVPKDKNSAFGMLKVRGTIDDYEINHYTMMPKGNGSMFLPVKAEIRKKIKKEEGDFVRVTLYKDDQPYQIPEEFVLRLKEEEGILEAFIKYKPWEQRMCVNWIYSAKRPETVNERIIKTIYRVQRKEKIV